MQSSLDALTLLRGRIGRISTAVNHIGGDGQDAFAMLVTQQLGITDDRVFQAYHFPSLSRPLQCIAPFCSVTLRLSRAHSSYPNPGSHSSCLRSSADTIKLLYYSTYVATVRVIPLPEWIARTLRSSCASPAQGKTITAANAMIRCATAPRH